MEEKRINIITAKLAKEKGFNLEVKYFFNSHALINKGYILDSVTDWNNYKDGDGECKRISAPSQTILQRWLRDTHQIIVTVIPVRGKHDTPFYPWDDIQQNEVFFGCIIHNSNGLADDIDMHFDSYEEGLQKALDLI